MLAKLFVINIIIGTIINIMWVDKKLVPAFKDAFIGALVCTGLMGLILYK